MNSRCRGRAHQYQCHRGNSISSLMDFAQIPRFYQQWIDLRHAFGMPGWPLRSILWMWHTNELAMAWESQSWLHGILGNPPLKWHLSCGRNYVHGELAMSKLGGPLSVVKVLNFLSFHYINDQGFRGCSIVMECWSLINPGLLGDRVFFLACPGFALRATSF